MESSSCGLGNPGRRSHRQLFEPVSSPANRLSATGSGRRGIAVSQGNPIGVKHCRENNGPGHESGKDERLSAYLGEDPVDVAQRQKSAVADYVEFMSQDLGGSGKSSSNEQFVPADG